MDFADKQLINVPVFTPGHLKDSRGQERVFSNDDIQDIIDAFSQGAPTTVPIKVGHSTDEFNTAVAKELGIPELLVKGEGESGKGAVQLGRITALKMADDGHLLADMTVREPVAKMITDELFVSLSSELQFNREQGGKTYPTVMSGLALLGAQRPALGDLPTLQQATMLEDGTSADAVYFAETNLAERDERGRFAKTGSTQVANDTASSGDGDDNVYTVPVQDLTRGRQVFASVSAANEVTAKRTALRVVENFLFSLGGPLGTALGVTGGAVLSARLIAGKPLLGGIKGLVKWKFEESVDMYAEAVELAKLISKTEEPKEVPMTLEAKYADNPAMASCLAKAKEDGVTDPEAHCKAKFDEEAGNHLGELAKLFNLSEWDGPGILVKVQELQKGQGDQAKFEEETRTEMASLQRQLRIAHYTEAVSGFDLIPGTKEDNAEKLVVLELKADEDTAKEMLASWQAQQTSASAMKLSETILVTGDVLPESEFSEAVEKLMAEDKDLSRADAIKNAARANPALAAARND